MEDFTKYIHWRLMEFNGQVMPSSLAAVRLEGVVLQGPRPPWHAGQPNCQGPTRREHHLRSRPRAVQPHACARRAWRLCASATFGFDGSRRVTRRSPQSGSRSSGEKPLKLVSPSYFEGWRSAR